MIYDASDDQPVSIALLLTLNTSKNHAGAGCGGAAAHQATANQAMNQQCQMSRILTFF